jgi:branched-subunit amino acid permease
MKGHKLLYGASVLMVVGFLIHLLIDYQKYKVSFTSAPFWLWIAVDAMLWLIPAAIAAIAGYVAKKKLTKKENRK